MWRYHLYLALCTLPLVCVVFVGSVGAQPATHLETLPTGLILTGLHDPVYPQMARMAAIQGDVELTLYVRPDGTVESVRMFSGHPMLKDAAIESAKASHFECQGCNDGLWPYSLRYEFRIVASDPEQYCDQVTNEVPPLPKLDSARHQVAVTAKQVWTCDPTVQLRSVRIRSAKCLYLWKCGLRPED
jgi:TonB family protein